MLLEHNRAWAYEHFPGELGPAFDHPVSEELFPNMQLSPPLMLEHTEKTIISFSYYVSSNGKNTCN